MTLPLIQKAVRSGEVSVAELARRSKIQKTQVAAAVEGGPAWVANGHRLVAALHSIRSDREKATARGLNRPQDKKRTMRGKVVSR